MKEQENPMLRIEAIGCIHTAFPQKFGLPRQSGLVPGLTGEVHFFPKYRNADALRGLSSFTHLWLLWQFTGFVREGSWCPTVRPPRLGGNKRVGVFATRSPNRPNPIGLSCVRLLRIEPSTPEGPVLYVEGIDMQDGTLLLDIKPYLPYTDAHPEASGGFAERVYGKALRVFIPKECSDRLPAQDRVILEELLRQDPRPSYQEDPGRMYYLSYSGKEIGFTVEGDCLTVRTVAPSASRRGGETAVKAEKPAGKADGRGKETSEE